MQITDPDANGTVVITWDASDVRNPSPGDILAPVARLTLMTGSYDVNRDDHDWWDDLSCTDADEGGT